MHDDPSRGPTDPSDLTQRQAVVPSEPAAPIKPTVPAQSEPVDRYVPSPEPRSDWVRTWDEAPPVTPERWFEPAAPPASATTPVATDPKRGRTGSGSLLAVSLLSAVLASGGTVLALEASGALDRQTVVASGVAQSTNVGTLQPVAIDESSATIAVAERVSPAVVRITVTGTSNAGNLGVIPSTGVGSGVIFDSNGWILTNHHVVQGGDKFDVELKDGRILVGKVYGIDTLTDLAIVKVEATGLPTATSGDSDSLKVGQLVVAIGSPLGTYSNSVTSGIVSAKGRAITTDNNDSLSNLIQTDAAINPGNSGGPLLDAGGNVIGINTAIASNSNGIGFAIPIDIARPIMSQAIAGEPLSRPYLGIHFVSITRPFADEEQLPVRIGALVRGIDANGRSVSGVEAGKPADLGGVKDGDIITSVSGKVIDEEHPLDATLAQFSPGDTVTVDVLRDGVHVSLQVTLGTRPAGL
jgi:S1-C subfamily serine protease